MGFPLPNQQGAMTNTESSFPLTYLRLRFTCMAETPLNLGGLRAGSNLRGALLNVMRRATCDQSPLVERGLLVDPDHTAHCPVCWLVAANEHPGRERRGYSIIPPTVAAERLEPGEHFDFHLTLFGDAVRFLPYFVLAVPEVGRIGVGPGRGKFCLKRIDAEHPLEGDWPVLAEGDTIVRPPQQTPRHRDLCTAARVLAGQLNTRQPCLRINFLTPLRLIVNKHLLKAPDFGALFNHILLRVDHLAAQHARAAPRPVEERERLWNLANQVWLVEDGTRWVDLPSGSSRTGKPTWISGLIGPARYTAAAEVWQEMLPWLLWGQVVQVGKDTVKGNGSYQISILG